MRQVSSPVRRGAGRKGRKDLARSLPGFKVLGVLFLTQVSPAFLPSKKACGTHKFRHFGVGQQYPTLFCDSTDHKLYLFAGIVKNSHLRAEMEQGALEGDSKRQECRAPQKLDTVSVSCHPERRRRSFHQPPVNAQIVLRHPRHAKPFFKDLPTACAV
jgi:hypothetical protein